MPLTSIKAVLEEIKSDLTDYLKTKGDIMQLKAAEKGSPLIAKTIYMSILMVIAIIIGSVVLPTIIFALSLIFVESGTEAFSAIRALTFGALILLALFVMVLVILLAIKNNTIAKMESTFINKVIDQQEQKDREEEAKKQLAKATTTTATITTNTMLGTNNQCDKTIHSTLNGEEVTYE